MDQTDAEAKLSGQEADTINNEGTTDATEFVQELDDFFVLPEEGHQLVKFGRDAIPDKICRMMSIILQNKMIDPHTPYRP